MGQRRSRRRRKRKEPSAEVEPAARKGWLRPRTAVIVIAIVSLLNAANVFRGVHQAADLTATVVYVLLAFVTPPLIAGLAYLAFRKLSG